MLPTSQQALKLVEHFQKSTEKLKELNQRAEVKRSLLTLFNSQLHPRSASNMVVSGIR